MQDRVVKPTNKFSGNPTVPGDKSISHRALIFGAMAEGETSIEGLLESADIQSTAECLKLLGVEISSKNNRTLVQGRGLKSFSSPNKILDCGNSGTTIRLLMGLMCGQNNFSAELSGDASLVRRPMRRVAEPLTLMGARLKMMNHEFAPIKIQGCQLQGIDYELKIASAQVKTALILAGLNAKGRTCLSGKIHSRDHTERMLQFFGVEIKATDSNIIIQGGQTLQAQNIKVPGDPSAAAFWMAGACLVPNSNIEMQNISLNPSRLGFVRILQKMGADIQMEITSEYPEPVGNIRLRATSLKGVKVYPEDIPAMIDELPLLAVLASQAKGTTEVLGAEELRFKETDRIEAVAINLRAMGGVIETRADGFTIAGNQKLNGAVIKSFQDHRIAMSFSLAALIAEGESLIEGADCVRISYPDFYKTLQSLTE